MLIDRFAPEFQFSERHTRLVAAPPETLYWAIKAVKSRDIHGFQALMKFRGMLSPVKREFGDTPIFLEALGVGFFPLADESSREVVLGHIGQFWKLTGSHPVRIADAAMFLAFEDPEFAKATLNFHIEDTGGGRCRLTTETRIALFGPAARRKFLLYWIAIRAGSGFIRKQWLAAIARLAEQAESTGISGGDTS